MLEETVRRLQALQEKAAELESILKLYNEARAPYQKDGEWRGEGWIINARKWIELVAAARGAKRNPELLAQAAVDARKVFHTLNEIRERCEREAPDQYARFIVESAAIADEARELID